MMKMKATTGLFEQPVPGRRRRGPLSHLLLVGALLLAGVNADATPANDSGASDQDRPERTAPAAQEIIDRHFAAIGGFRQYLSITSMLTVARVRQGSSEAVITTARQAPFYYRVETSPGHDPDSEVRMEGSNGEELWHIDTTQPDAELTVEPWRYVQAYDFYGPLVDHQRKGIIFAYQGRHAFRGREADVVRAWYPGGLIEDLMFSAENGIMLGSRTPNPEDPDQPGFVFLIANYQQFEGVLLPTEIHTLLGERLLQTLSFENITVNYDFDSAIFDPPAL